MTTWKYRFFEPWPITIYRIDAFPYSLENARILQYFSPWTQCIRFIVMRDLLWLVSLKFGKKIYWCCIGVVEYRMHLFIMTFYEDKLCPWIEWHMPNRYSFLKYMNWHLPQINYSWNEDKKISGCNDSSSLKWRFREPAIKSTRPEKLPKGTVLLSCIYFFSGIRCHMNQVSLIHMTHIALC